MMHADSREVKSNSRVTANVEPRTLTPRVFDKEACIFACDKLLLTARVAQRIHCAG